MFRQIAKLISVQSPLTPLRQMSGCTFNAQVLKYSEYGEPCSVVKIEEQEIDAPKNKEVVVKILLAPINPADINTIQGKYPSKPPLPAVAGNEGLGEVVAVGDKVESLQVGDWIVPNTNHLGTWATFLKRNEEDFMKVRCNIDPIALCQINVNPPSAYRMLKDFANLKPGDTIIQNGANSAVGQAVHQLCRAWGIKSIGVVRDRPEIMSLISHLKCIGATEVWTEDQSHGTDVFRTGEWKKPKLALNCVGGKSALSISRHLEDGCTMVTYGGMSRQPVTVPTAALIFKDIRFKGFWMTRWTKKHFDSPARTAMFSEIMDLMECGDIAAPPHQLVQLSDYKEAMHSALSTQGFIGKKMILQLNCI
ncbi:MECR family protein [Megaselia abdita]